MPSSRASGNIKLIGDPTSIQSLWDGFISGAVAAGAIEEAGNITFQGPLEAPEEEDSGPGNDVYITPPDFTPDPNTDYTVRYSDDNGATWSSQYSVQPNYPVTIYNGYVSGRIFAIFTGELAGAPTIPLP